MPVRTLVRPSSYWDSLVLLRLAAGLRAQPGVREAAALLGTPASHELLRQAGLASPASEAAGPVDLVVAVDASSADEAAAALRAVDGLLAASAGAGGPDPALFAPRTLRTALRRMPEATLVAISVPGAHAAAEARAALRSGRDVFLFSDHVPLSEEVALKALATRRGLLCMGPDCGTAYVGGAGLGFANVVPRGRVGIVAASGTGLQAVACHLAALGAGISHGLGVGGRDLGAEVGGAMTAQALDLLARDPATGVVVVVSKPPHPAVLPTLVRALGRLPKPAVVCCLGASRPPGAPGRWVATLDAAARAAVAALGGGGAGTPPGPEVDGLGPRLARLAARPGRRPAGLLGLFTGGTLAHEAATLLAPHLGPLDADLDSDARHRLVDLGDDRYTVGRPHPMLDPEARAGHIMAAGRDPRVGVLLLDLVLGRGVHPDPATPLAGAVRDARGAAAAAGRALLVIASVVGTAGDPQGLGGQVAALEAAGVEVLPSSAAAARLAAVAADPSRAAAVDRGGTGEPDGEVTVPAAARAESSGAEPAPHRLGPPRVVSLGLASFARDLAAAGVPVLAVAWTPPAGGDPVLAALLARLEDEEG